MLTFHRFKCGLLYFIINKQSSIKSITLIIHLIRTWIVAIPSTNSFGGGLADKLLFLNDVARYCSLLYIKTILLLQQSHAIIYYHYIVFDKKGIP